MDVLTFGAVAIGVAGGSLVVAAIAEKLGVEINNNAINLALEITKYGGIFYLIQHLAKIFM